MSQFSLSIDPGIHDKYLHDHDDPLSEEESQNTDPGVPAPQKLGHARQHSRLSMMSSRTSQTHVSRRRFTTQLDASDLGDVVGEEPGIDIQNTVVELPDSVGSIVTIVDYSRDHMESQSFELRAQVQPVGPCCICGPGETVSTRLYDILDGEQKLDDGVRWIIVNGLSWEAIGPLATFYDLHPLAVEATLDIPQRAKVEVFKEQIFCCFNLYRLVRSRIQPNAVQRVLLRLLKLIRSFNREKVPDHGNTDKNFMPEESSMRKKWDSPETSSHSVPYSSTTAYSSSTLTSTLKTDSIANAESTSVSQLLSQIPHRTIHSWQGKLAQKRTKKASHYVEVEQVSMFLTKDNSVLTFFEYGANEILEPLSQKLRSPKSMLRESNDPNVLVQAILDAAVDMLDPISTNYQHRLSSLQQDSLNRPTLHQTYVLHNLVTDLGALRSFASSMMSLLSSIGSQTTCTASTAANMYYRDVVNHTERYVDRIETMSQQAKALSGLIFNTISTSANDSLSMLSVVATIFMPLTFLTGYYGMNFQEFTEIQTDVHHYWKVAAPAATVLTMILLLPWLKSITYTIKSWWSKIVI